MKTTHNHHPGALARLSTLAVIAVTVAAIFFLWSTTAHAGSATWDLNPTSDDWNSVANWTPETVPNGATDVATFGVSSTTDLNVGFSTPAQVDSIIFNAGASPYTITLAANRSFVDFTIVGDGIINNSGTTQTFVAAANNIEGSSDLTFTNSATAGSMNSFTVEAGTNSASEISFLSNASAGSAAFTVAGSKGSESLGGMIYFGDSATASDSTLVMQGGGARHFGSTLTFDDFSTASNANITIEVFSNSNYFEGSSNAAEATITISGELFFRESADAGNAVFNLANGTLSFSDTATADHGTFGSHGFVGFSSTATADHGVFTLGASSQGLGYGTVQFSESATAGHGTFTTLTGDERSLLGAFIYFSDTSTADQAIFTIAGASSTKSTSPEAQTFFMDSANAGHSVFTINGGAINHALGGLVEFLDTSDASSGTFVINPGAAGGQGGRIQFLGDSLGSRAKVQLSGNGSLDVSGHNLPGITIGSLQGSGDVFLGANNLTIGATNSSAVFSGTLQDGGMNGGIGGSITKIGNGKLTLHNLSTYTGPTTINAGVVLATNNTGSATGSGPVTVSGGSLGGTGDIAGGVTVGFGSSAAGLAPGNASKLGTLVIQGTLDFGPVATFDIALNSATATADEVTADGVTINSDAQIALEDLGTATLVPGTTFIIMNNTAATLISGTFANLPDASIVTVGANLFLVNYEGGDGNDLTLTVQ